MKWSNLKDKFIDMFYKEIEVEEETLDVDVKDASGQVYGTEQYRLASIEPEKKDVKVRYQYPRKRDVPFRFPVIPDEEKFSSGHSVPRKPRDKNNSMMTNIPRQEKTTTREMDDVPAFMRRNRSQNQKQPSAQQLDSKASKEAKASKAVDNGQDEPIKIYPHSKPDELDAVFKKRDRKREEVEKDIQQPEELTTKKLLNHSLENKAVTNNLPTTRYKKENTEDKAEQQDLTLSSERRFNRDSKNEKVDAHINDARINNETTIQQTQNDQPKQVVSPIQQHVEGKVEDTPLEPDVPEYLLNDHGNESMIDEDWLIEQQILLEDTFTHFNIDATVVNVTQGPSVTRFEIQPALGVKVSKIKNLSDDLKLNLAAKDIRIEAPIPGKNTIGIEIPNKTMHLVNLQEIFESNSFKDAESPLTVALGLTIEGSPIVTNIDEMPHGLIAGATGSGKSVCINTIILSLLYKAHHDDVKLLLVDPKMVELTPYNNIPHLIAPVITNVKAATKALKWAVNEMEDRYRKFVDLGVRNIQKYNEKVAKGETDDEKMSSIVIIIDELSDLMMVSPQEVEDAICRIAQKARACGIHLLLATQRPSVDVITGLIKANIPTRIAFSVSSQVDSRTMIDAGGAEKLLGKGDMLFVENGAGKAVRLQGPFVSDEEIERVAGYVRSIAEPVYLFEEEQLLNYVEEEEEDDLMGDAVRFVVSHGQASTSLLQRQFRIGYNRAARLIDNLEEKAIISEQNGSKPREVLVSEEQIEHL